MRLRGRDHKLDFREAAEGFVEGLLINSVLAFRVVYVCVCIHG